VNGQLLTKTSEPAKVDAYMKALKHPLADVAAALRSIILRADPSIGEEIKWNAPAFFYAGALPPFNPKDYKRHIAVFNLARPDCIRIIFPSGARAANPAGLLQGDYADGRRLALFHDMEEVEARSAALQAVIIDWLATLDRG